MNKMICTLRRCLTSVSEKVDKVPRITTTPGKPDILIKEILSNFAVHLRSINLHMSEMIVLNIDFGAFLEC